MRPRNTMNNEKPRQYLIFFHQPLTEVIAYEIIINIHCLQCHYVLADICLKEKCENLVPFI